MSRESRTRQSAPTVIKGPLPGEAVEAYRQAHHGHLPGERSETDLRIEYIRLMQAHKRDFESLLEMHVRVMRDALKAPVSEQGTLIAVREEMGQTFAALSLDDRTVGTELDHKIGEKLSRWVRVLKPLCERQG